MGVKRPQNNMSLQPLTPEEALRRTMQVPPPAPDPKLDRGKKIATGKKWATMSRPR